MLHYGVVDLIRNDKFWEIDAKMPSQELIRNSKVSRGIISRVERKPSLHGKRVANNNSVIIKLITTCFILERHSGNIEQLGS